MFLSIVLLIQLAIISFLFYYYHHKVELVRKGKYRVKLFEKFPHPHLDSFNYVYILQTEEKLLGFIPIYKSVGSYEKDSNFGFEYFVVYKFNSVKDAQKYYYSVIEKNI